MKKTKVEKLSSSRESNNFERCIEFPTKRKIRKMMGLRKYWESSFENCRCYFPLTNGNRITFSIILIKFVPSKCVVCASLVVDLPTIVRF